MGLMEEPVEDTTLALLADSVAKTRACLIRRIKPRLNILTLRRTHLSLDKETPSERPVSNRASPEAKLIELPRVGGLHHRCEWSEAA
jgi:hypothetical protein